MERGRCTRHGWLASCGDTFAKIKRTVKFCVHAHLVVAYVRFHIDLVVRHTTSVELDLRLVAEILKTDTGRRAFEIGID
ncbi:hypothetical protein EVAR_56193_1 [Eumeta japonica]|uniref:Uncharacterized protein n=1 Tax=Eumeta variegata TaxID=151549 RepID=A0A4C1Y3C3_EUMVA|nr:hypothetical protein EVAR_56193_1 [Eumeta japonica]